MDKKTRPVHPAVLHAKAMVEAHLEHRQLTDAWLYGRMKMNKGSYYDLWRRGSLRYDVLARIADALSLSVHALLSPPATYKADASAPSQVQEPQPPPPTQRYLEDRVRDLEQDMARLKARKT